MEANIIDFEKAFNNNSRYNMPPCAKLYYHDTIDSTNDELRRLAVNGAEHGTVVAASCQTNGHGRSGRSFYSPSGGNLYISILLRPNNLDRMHLFTPFGAVATALAIKEVCDVDVKIKWVNDLYIADKKICGILAQGYDFGTEDCQIIVGIGINICGKTESVPDDIRQVYGSIYDSDEVDTNSIAGIVPKIAASLYYNYMKMYSGCDDAKYMQLYRELSNVIGRKVTYYSGNDAHTIDVTDIDDRGRIVTVDENGIQKAYSDGEIRIKL